MQKETWHVREEEAGKKPACQKRSLAWLEGEDGGTRRTGEGGRGQTCTPSLRNPDFSLEQGMPSREEFQAAAWHDQVCVF